MIALLSQIGGLLMLAGIMLMALPVIRVGRWGWTPWFEAGLALFLFGTLAALGGAIGWLVGGVLALPVMRAL